MLTLVITEYPTECVTEADSLTVRFDRDPKLMFWVNGHPHFVQRGGITVLNERGIQIAKYDLDG